MVLITRMTTQKAKLWKSEWVSYIKCYTPCNCSFKLKGLERKLKLIDYLFYVVVAPISLFCFANWGWGFYSTITERPGQWGSMHEYYQLSKEVYSIYCFVISVVAFVFLVLPIVLLAKRRSLSLQRLYIYFLWFALLVILSEFALSFRFQGKG
jgi:hypothetical protein